ncbi:Hypothetical protein HVR_LOCUS1235 [uncultured virus]|nr:Hypothetical protein HVR_LOCUS1235 [uncultured virus]
MTIPGIALYDPVTMKLIVGRSTVFDLTEYSYLVYPKNNEISKEEAQKQRAEVKREAQQKRESVQEEGRQLRAEAQLQRELAQEEGRRQREEAQLQRELAQEEGRRQREEAQEQARKQRETAQEQARKQRETAQEQTRKQRESNEVITINSNEDMIKHFERGVIEHDPSTGSLSVISNMVIPAGKTVIIGDINVTGNTYRFG